MSFYDVSTITGIDDYFEKIVTHSCCGTSKFVKTAAKSICISSSETKLGLLKKFSTAPDTQISKIWRDKALELLNG